ncbi:class I SAM-dependent methyltransferase [Thermodesulfobacteriota bacterium]
MISELETLPENSQATRTRLRFIASALNRKDGGRLLDFGCGTGEHLTRHVGILFPNYEVTGIDSDPKSIQFAKSAHKDIKNLHFTTRVPQNKRFDCIIASEVLEHVENPFEFLIHLRSRLKKDAHLILTVPNGYGGAECMSFIEACLTISGLMSCLRKVKGTVMPPKNKTNITPDTLSVSPHINFFTFNKLQKLFHFCGLQQVRYSGRMFLYDFISSPIFNKYEKMAVLNANLGGCLPPSMVSDWMFLLKKGHDLPPDKKMPVYRRNIVEKFRRKINFRRWIGC